MNLLQLSEREEELLWSLSQEQEQDELTEPISEADQEKLIDSYLSAKEDFYNKIDGYVNLIKGLKYRAEYRKNEAKRLAELSKKDENLANLLQARFTAYSGEAILESKQDILKS